MAAILKPFKACAPAPEVLGYPLFFPEPNYRGRPVPNYPEESAKEAAARQEMLRKEQEMREIQEKLQPRPDVQREKFSKVNSGKPITTAAAGDLARSLGFAPSQGDLAKLFSKHGDAVTFEQFQAWQKETCLPHKVEDTPEALIRVFQQWDLGGTGVLKRRQVQSLLGNYGDALTPREIDVLFHSLGYTGDDIPYEDFIKKLLAE